MKVQIVESLIRNKEDRKNTPFTIAYHLKLHHHAADSDQEIIIVILSKKSQCEMCREFHTEKICI